MARKATRFKRPNHFVCVAIDSTDTMERHAVLILIIHFVSDLIPAHCNDVGNEQLCFTIAIGWVFHSKGLRVGCYHCHFTCICAVEHIYQYVVPVVSKSMVTIELQLVSLIVVVSLDHVSSVVDIFGFLVPYVLHDKSWRVV